MFISTSGNLLESAADVLVNAVNCKGVMGKGLAYSFKMRFPDMYADYVKNCRNGTLRIGTLHTYTEKDKIIVNFPTKEDWRNPSKLEYIKIGLDELKGFIEKNSFLAIAIPKLGCGLGGLRWEEVRKMIINKLESVSDKIDIYLYEN